MGGLALAGALWASSAQAQLAATATAQTDYQFRGYSVSQGRPVLGGALSYDHVSGVYATASIMAVIVPDDGPDLLSVQGGLGYAHRIARGPTLDIGIVHVDYSKRFGNGRAAAYSEVYAGLITKHVSGHVYYSPDYLRRGVKTVYGDLSGVISPLPKWRLTGHVGALTQTAGPRNRYVEPTQYDVSIGAGRQIGALDVHLNWSTGGPGQDYYARRERAKSRLILGATYTF